MMASSTTSQASRNKRLWKEGYVKNIAVKPNVIVKNILFIVTAKVHASMTNISYIVYVHLIKTMGTQ